MAPTQKSTQTLWRLCNFLNYTINVTIYVNLKKKFAKLPTLIIEIFPLKEMELKLPAQNHSRSHSFDPFGQRKGRDRSLPLTKRIEALGTRMAQNCKNLRRHSRRWSNRALNYCYEWASTAHFYPHKRIDLLNLLEFYRASFSLVWTNEQMVDGWLTNKSARLTFVLL